MDEVCLSGLTANDERMPQFILSGVWDMLFGHGTEDYALDNICGRQ